MGTNFLPLPSSGFTVLRPKQQTAPSHGFLPCINDISACGFDQGIFALDKISPLYNTVNTKQQAVARTVTTAAFFVPFSWPYGFPASRFIERHPTIDNSRNCPVPVRAGRPCWRGNSFGFFYCRNTKQQGGAPMASKQNGFRPGSITSIIHDFVGYQDSLSEASKGGIV